MTSLLQGECVQQWNLFKCQTSTFHFSAYRPNLFEHLLTHSGQTVWDQITLELLLCLLLLCISGLRSVMPLINDDWLIDWLIERCHCCDRCISRQNNTSARSFSSTTLSRPQANFLHQTRIAGPVKHLSPYTGRISEWMAFGKSPFAHRKWITNTVPFTGCFQRYSVTVFIVYKWRHSDVIVIKLTADAKN